MIAILPILVVVFVLLAYFLPSLIGSNKRNAGAIFALNLLLGWTLIGWVVSLVWALTKENAPNTIVVQPVSVPVPQTWICATCRSTLNRSDTFCTSCGSKVA